jgi:hypothetical protein
MYELEVTTRSRLTWFARVSRFAFLTEGGLSSASPLKTARPSLSTLSPFPSSTRLTTENLRVIKSRRYIIRVNNNYLSSVTTLTTISAIASVAAIATWASFSWVMLVGTFLTSLAAIAAWTAVTTVTAVLPFLSLTTLHQEFNQPIDCVHINIESSGHRAGFTIRAGFTFLSFYAFTT